MRRFSTSLVVLIALLVAVPVFAQASSDPATSSTSGSLSASVWQQVDFSGQRGTVTPPPTPTRGYFLRLFGGIASTEGETGAGFGGGIAGRPFGTNKAEVQGDVSYFRISGVNDLEFSGNFIYNFVVTGQQFYPYAGAGIVISHASAEGASSTDTGFQILGGVNIPINPREQAFRGELRIQLFSGFHTIEVLGMVSF